MLLSPFKKYCLVSSSCNLVFLIKVMYVLAQFSINPSGFDSISVEFLNAFSVPSMILLICSSFKLFSFTVKYLHNSSRIACNNLVNSLLAGFMMLVFPLIWCILSIQTPICFHTCVWHFRFSSRTTCASRAYAKNFVVYRRWWSLTLSISYNCLSSLSKIDHGKGIHHFNCSYR